MTNHITVKLTESQLKALIELIDEEEMNRFEFSTTERVGFLMRIRTTLARAKNL